MNSDSLVHHRRSIRLKNYDYSKPGAYFVTLVTKYHQNIFGNVSAGEMMVNPLGGIIRSSWSSLPRFFPIRLDEWVVMPNHLHGIIWILDPNVGTGEAFGTGTFNAEMVKMPNASPLQLPTGTMHNSLGAIIQNFKSVSTRKIHQWIYAKRMGEAFDNDACAIPAFLLSNASPVQIYQRNYFERIVRNEKELNRIREYVIDNPRRWEEAAKSRQLYI